MVKLECPLAKKNFVVPPIIQFYKYSSSDIGIEPSRASPISCDNTTERYLLQQDTTEVSFLGINYAFSSSIGRYLS